MVRSYEKGITIVALMVSVVVLIIMASITIGAVTDYNGIINGAKNARNYANKKDLEEAVQKEILASVDKKGVYDAGKAADGIESAIGATVTNTNGSLKIEKDEYTISVDAEGNITKIEEESK